MLSRKKIAALFLLASTGAALPGDLTGQAEYFERFPKDRYRTEIESWRHLQSQNIEFTMKRLREPIKDGGP